MKRIFASLAALVIVFGCSVSVNAALIDRGGLLIYDDDLDITWLGDANYAYTSGYNANGRMFGDDAVAWADSLVFGGYSDWRLPTSDACMGVNCTGSEMGHLFYSELSGTAYSPITTSGDPDLALFNNNYEFSAGPGYWSGTPYASNPLSAWNFGFYTGYQTAGAKNATTSFALAVRDGDVAVVPEPGTLLLLGFGLVGLTVRRKKFQTKTP